MIGCSWSAKKTSLEKFPGGVIYVETQKTISRKGVFPKKRIILNVIITLTICSSQKYFLVSLDSALQKAQLEIEKLKENLTKLKEKGELCMFADIFNIH